MSNFCQNPECDCFNYTVEYDQIEIPSGSNGDTKLVERSQYIIHSPEKGYEKFYLCSVCMGVLDLLKISI